MAEAKDSPVESGKGPILPKEEKILVTANIQKGGIQNDSSSWQTSA
jgi:hypothetical protein